MTRPTDLEITQLQNRIRVWSMGASPMRGDAHSYVCSSLAHLRLAMDTNVTKVRRDFIGRARVLFGCAAHIVEGRVP